MIINYYNDMRNMFLTKESNKEKIIIFKTIKTNNKITALVFVYETEDFSITSMGINLDPVPPCIEEGSSFIVCLCANIFSHDYIRQIVESNFWPNSSDVMDQAYLH